MKDDSASKNLLTILRAFNLGRRGVTLGVFKIAAAAASAAAAAAD